MDYTILRKKLLRTAGRLRIKPYSLSEEIALAKFIESKFRKAAKLFLRRWGKADIFFQCLGRVWRHQDDMFLVDDPLLQETFPEICKPIYIYTGTCPLGEHTRGAVQGGSGGWDSLHLCLEDIERSSDKKEFLKKLESLIRTVYHEADHVTMRGSDLGGDMERRLRYLMNEGEIRAISKEIAYFYWRTFLGKRFHYGKLLSYLQRHALPGSHEFEYLQILELLKRPTTAPLTKKENIILAEKIVAGQHPEFSRHLLKRTFAKYIVSISFFVLFFLEHRQETYNRKKGILPRYLQTVL